MKNQRIPRLDASIQTLFAVAMICLVAAAGAGSTLGARGVGGLPGLFSSSHTSFRSGDAAASVPSQPARPPYVANTLVLVNNTLIPGNFLAADNVLPVGDALDDGTHEVFVTESGSSNVTAINDTTKEVMANITVGSSPQGIAYDNRTAELFVADSGSNDVSVINDMTDTVVASIPVGDSPNGIAYDNRTAEVFVTNSGSNSVTVINDSSDAVVTNTTVGSDPLGLAFDSGTDSVFVANFNSANVSVINDTTNTVVATVPVGFFPDAVTYDKGTGEIFVANFGSNNLSVINDTTYTVVATIGVGVSPDGVAYDRGKGEVFVANSGSANVSVVNDTTDLVVATAAVGFSPEGLAYDQGRGQVFVANFESDSVSVINDTTSKVVLNISLGSSPYAVTYGDGTGELFVANYGTGKLNIINGTTGQVVANVVAGNHPVAVAFDNGSGLIFVANEMTGTVSVINDSTNRLLATVVVGTFPVGIAYDSRTGNVYVANEASSTISVINMTMFLVVNTISVGPYPSGITYDDGTGQLFVPHYLSNIVTVINGAGHVKGSVVVGSHPVSAAYDSGRGEVFVANGDSNNVSVINDTTDTLVATVPVGSLPDGVAYDNATGEVFVANGDSDNVSVINDTSNTVTASVPVGGFPLGVAYDPVSAQVYVCNLYQGTLSIISFVPAPTYAVTFAESGLPAGTSWSVTLDGILESSTNGSIAFTIHNGTYAYSIGAVPGWNQTTLPYSGSLTVNGTSLAEPTLIFSQVEYPVTFTEVGLPPGTSWSITLNGTLESSNGSSINFSEPNGTYAYSITPLPGWDQSTLSSSGLVNVTGSSVVEPSLAYTAFTYSVAFAESGLPSGTLWSVMLNGTFENTTGNSLNFTEPNGTHAYSIAPVPGWNQTTLPSAGTLNVTGASVMEPTLLFAQVEYAVTFSETGLPVGTSWSVTLNGSQESSTGVSIAFIEPNGSYAYSIAPVAGWDQTTLPSTGTLDVNGAPLTEPTLAFTLNEYAVTFTEAGLVSGTLWSVTLEGTVHSSTSNPITFSELNGTYAFTIGSVAGYSVNPASGMVTVSGSNPATQMIDFTSTMGSLYAVTISEIGLPSGTNWSATLNGTTQSSTTATIQFTEPNGTYSFSIPAVTGYSGNRTAGMLTVSGTPVVESIGFTATVSGQFVVKFVETGLPTGTSWSVTFNGATQSSTTGTIMFTEPNGTYAFSIGGVAGYSANQTSGTVAVSGGLVTQTIGFSLTSSSPSRLTSLDFLVIAAVIVLLVIVAAVALTRRKGETPSSTPQPASPAGADDRPPYP
jgi:YVTN family beta-propeller protein